MSDVPAGINWVRYDLDCTDEWGIAVLNLECATCRDACGAARREWLTSPARGRGKELDGPVYGLGRPPHLGEAIRLAVEHERLIHGQEAQR